MFSRKSAPYLHGGLLVRIREHPEEDPRLVETGQSAKMTASTIRRRYGVEPALLRDVRITGDSMLGTLKPGDRARAVLSDCWAPNDGTVHLLRGPTSLLIRRVRLKGNCVVLVADNPEVPNRDVAREDWETKYEPIARILEIHRSV